MTRVLPERPARVMPVLTAKPGLALWRVPRDQRPVAATYTDTRGQVYAHDGVSWRRVSR